METPSSVKKASPGSSASYRSKSKQEGKKADRTALIDITNDSPIVGVAIGSGSFVKSPIKIDLTPGSGEAILRGQVKTLLQKIEEESELAAKIPSFPRLVPPSRSILGFERSPLQILAPTPNNTPHIPGAGAVAGAGAGEVVQEDFLRPPPQIISPIVQRDEPLGPCVLNRALLFDSPDKQETSSSSGGAGSTVTNLACQESVSSNDSFTISSIWSIQGNAGTDKGEETESEFDVEELCKGFRDFAVGGGKFEGKHIRFVYNSDGEMEGEEECILPVPVPVPEAKHLRFQEEEGEGEGED